MEVYRLCFHSPSDIDERECVYIYIYIHTLFMFSTLVLFTCRSVGINAERFGFVGADFRVCSLR